MAHPDLQALSDSLFKFTRTLLNDLGGFNPWGAAMYSSGEIQWLGASNGEDYPPAQELIDLLTDTFKRECTRGHLRAVGICCDVLVQSPGQSVKSDAVCCSLEHISGEAVDMFMPYTKTSEGLRYGEIYSSPREPRFFLPLGTQ